MSTDASENKVLPGNLVVIESPYAGDVENNTRYARRAMRDSLMRGEYPIASHLLYTQPGILNDDDPIEREWGIRAGLTWASKSDVSVFYLDLGMSSGMLFGLRDAMRSGRIVRCRWLDELTAFRAMSEKYGFRVDTPEKAAELTLAECVGIVMAEFVMRKSDCQK